MLERCYSKKYLESRPSYIGTSVCSEWLSATAFKKWMDQQDWQGKCLDKDIIVPKSKLYSPETCAFVLDATNKFVIARDACRGDYPIGVSLCKRTGKYQAYCGNPFFMSLNIAFSLEYPLPSIICGLYMPFGFPLLFHGILYPILLKTNISSVVFKG